MSPPEGREQKVANRDVGTLNLTQIPGGGHRQSGDIFIIALP